MADLFDSVRLEIEPVGSEVVVRVIDRDTGQTHVTFEFPPAEARMYATEMNGAAAALQSQEAAWLDRVTP